MNLNLPEIHVIDRPVVSTYVEITAENITPIAENLHETHQPATVTDGVLTFNHIWGTRTAKVGDWIELKFLPETGTYWAENGGFDPGARYQVVSAPEVEYVTQ